MSGTVQTIQRFVLDLESQLARANAQHEEAMAGFINGGTDSALSWMRHTGKRVVGLAGELMAARAALRCEVDARRLELVRYAGAP